MPASLKLQSEYGDDLVVLFVESQGANDDQAEAFTLQRKWLGGGSVWTTERPLDSGARGLPNYVLLDAEGKVVRKGSDYGTKLDDAIAELVDAAKGPPSGTPEGLEKAWKYFSKGDVAKAVAEARSQAEKDKVAAEVAEAAVAEFERRARGRLARAAWQLEHGYYEAAEDALDQLEKDLKGTDELAQRCSELAAQLKSDELKAEREAAKAIDRQLARFYEEGGDEKLGGRLERLIEKHEGTKAAERARRALELAASA